MSQTVPQSFSKHKPNSVTDSNSLTACSQKTLQDIRDYFSKLNEVSQTSLKSTEDSSVTPTKTSHTHTHNGQHDPITAEVPLVSSSPSNANMLNSNHFVNVSVGKSHTQALLDSGAAISCISTDFISTLDPSCLEWFPPTYKTAVGVGGEKHNITGSVQFTFTIAGLSLSHTFNVLPSPHHLILGLDWLTNNDATVNFGSSSTLTLQNTTVPLVGKTCYATVTNTTRLPPQSVCFLSVSLPQQATSHPGILLEGLDITHFNDHVHVTAGFDKPQSNAAHTCRIVNDSDIPVYLPAGTPVASIQPVDTDDISNITEDLTEAILSCYTAHNNAAKADIKDDIEFQVSQTLTPSQQQELLRLLSNSRSVFATSTAELGRTNLVEHSIEMQVDKPITQKPYRMSPQNKKHLDAIIDDLLTHKLIVPSMSKWSSPCLLVDKKDGSKRLVIDYRKINVAISPSTYPMPTLESIWDAIGDKKPKVFSTIDLWSGFFQIPLEKGSRKYTAFSTMDQKYEWVVMPMGLSNSPISFQSLMVQVLKDLHFQCAVVYCDDIIVYSSDFNSHLSDLQKVFDRLCAAGLTLKPSKCSFAVPSVKYLGHVLSDKGVTPNPEKTKLIDNFPQPAKVKHLRRFLGMTNYYRKFIPNYASLVSPLTALLKQNIPFKWDEACANAFQTLKTLLVSDPILRYPDHSKHFYLTTDASKTGISYILGQKDKHGNHYVCFYGARSLRPHERNYSATDLEALAVITGIDTYHTYLIDKPFTILTDHIALKQLLHSKFQGLTGKLARWGQAVMQYQFQVQFLEGSSNRAADCLSRIPASADPPVKVTCLSTGDLLEDPTETRSNSENSKSVQQYHLEWNSDTCQTPFLNAILPSDNTTLPVTLSGNSSHTDISIEDLPQSQLHCPDIGPFYKYKAYGKMPSDPNLNQRVVAERDCYTVIDNLLYHIPKQTKLAKHLTRQLVIPTKLKHTLLQQFHDSLMAGGHQGFDRTYNALRTYYYWPNMYADTYNYIKGCPTCQVSKRAYHTHPPPLKPLPIVEVFGRLHLDHIGPLTKTPDGFQHILVVVDSASKWVEAFPTKTQTAEETAKILYKEILTRYGAPRAILTDRGKAFVSKLLAGLCELFSVKLVHTTPYKPSTNATAERTNASILAGLRAYCSPDHSNWPDILPGILMAYRATPATQSTEYSPFYILFGKDMVRPIDVSLRPKDHLPESTKVSLDKFVENQKLCRKVAAENLAKAQVKQKEQFDKKAKDPDFKVGDCVLFKNNQKVVGRCPKLDPIWKDTYKIIKEGPNFTYFLEHVFTKKKTDAINARLLQHYHKQPTLVPDSHGDAEPDTALAPPAPPGAPQPPELVSPTAGEKQTIANPVPGPSPTKESTACQGQNINPRDSPSALNEHPIVQIKKGTYYKGKKWYTVKRQNMQGLQQVREDLVPNQLKIDFHTHYNMQGKRKKNTLKQFTKVIP